MRIWEFVLVQGKNGVTRKNRVMECEDTPIPERVMLGSSAKTTARQPCASSLGGPVGKGVLESRQLLPRLRAC